MSVARWQQAYVKDHEYTGSRNNALPMPPTLDPYLRWAQGLICNQLNGFLVNWYDADLGHYIGQHRDKTKELLRGSLIVTISLGAERAFRMSVKGSTSVDFPSAHGAVFVVP